MSNSSLWVIDKTWSGQEFAKYHNSWLFPAVVWNVLMRKYIPKEHRTRYGYTAEGYLFWAEMPVGGNSHDKWCILNSSIINGGDQVDRVCWDLSEHCIFNTKDKDFVAECIEKFTDYYLIQGNVDPPYQEPNHIIERFRKIADDIKNLPTWVGYFVIKETSSDSQVEYWFDRKRLCDWTDSSVCEFVEITDREITGYQTNLDLFTGGELNNGKTD